MQTTQTAQFQVGDLIRSKDGKRTARIEEFDTLEGAPYAVLKLCCKLFSGYVRPIFLPELSEWEYAKPKPNPARKQLAATKARLAKLQAVADAARKLMKYTEDFGELGVAVRTKSNELATFTLAGTTAARTLAAALKALDGES